MSFDAIHDQKDPQGLHRRRGALGVELVEVLERPDVALLAQGPVIL